MRARWPRFLVLSLVLLTALAFPALACTSIYVTKEASVDGSVMTAHTCDGWYDARTWVVPGGKHQVGEMVPIWQGLLHSDRTPPKKLGEIPEAEETYKYFYAGYPYMNEHGVIMGETTIGNRPELNSTEGIMYIEQLQILALQRCKTARDAVRLMGELAEKYGYIDAGECLTVGDQNEVWHFEILPPGMFKKGAIWAAVRIPEGNVGVSANRLRISTLDLNDPENYLCSSNVVDVAIENGWWSPDSGQPFKFCEAYGNRDRQIDFYRRRREWRVLSWAAPSLKLDPNGYEFPLSVKAERKISVPEMTKIYRDTYAGTPFDKAEKPVWYVQDAKGNWTKSPFASPHASAEMLQLMRITDERNIAIPRCSYFTILQSRAWMPSAIGTLCWFGLNNPDTSVYVPIYAGVSSLPPDYAVNDRTKFSFANRDSAWWAFNFVDNWVNRRYQDMIKDLRAVRDPFEAEQFALQPVIERTALDLHQTDPALAVQFLTNYTASRCRKAVDTFWSLAEQLIVKYDEKTF